LFAKKLDNGGIMKSNVEIHAFSMGFSSLFLFGSAQNLLNDTFTPETKSSINEKAWAMTSSVLNNSLEQEKLKLVE
jgi:hypothetical protein